MLHVSFMVLKGLFFIFVFAYIFNTGMYYMHCIRMLIIFFKDLHDSLLELLIALLPFTSRTYFYINILANHSFLEVLILSTHKAMYF